MKKLIFYIIFTFLTLMVKAQSTPMVFKDWATNEGTQYFFFKNKVITDNYNNVYIVGANHNGLDYDMMIVKYNSKGQLVWNQQYNGFYGDDIGIGLFVDANQNVYITGTVSTAANTDIITIKYKSDGTQLWVNSYNGSANNGDAGVDITGDSVGNVYITGYITDTSSFSRLVAIKYNSSGILQWATPYTTPYILNAAGVRISRNTGGGGNGDPVVSGCIQIDSVNYRHCAISFNAGNGNIGYIYIDTVTNYTGIDQVSDMAQDALGNVYIAGAIFDNANGYDYAVIKLDSNLNKIWERKYNGNSSLNDYAKSVRVDVQGNVYLTGYTTTNSQGKNITTLKYDESGTLIWQQHYNDTIDGDDEAMAMELDNNGNIYVTGYISTGIDHKDYQTIKYNTDGDVVWEIHTDGVAHLNDKASNITIDDDGGIIVTGISEMAQGKYEYKTIRYFEKQIIIPADFNSEVPAANFAYYENRGQLIGTDTLPVPEIKYYTINSAPAFYISENINCFVFAKSDTSASTPDTLHRIDLSFEKCNRDIRLFPLKEQSSYVNYFLPQCPEGITEVRGNLQLVTPDLYPDIDLIYSSNQNGLKYYYVVKPGGNPNDIKLIPKGMSSVHVNATTNDLTIYSSIGHLMFDRPAVYQLDSMNQIIQINGWTADWIYNASANTLRFNIGSYDNTKPLVIQVDEGNGAIALQSDRNLLHSTYYGNNKDDRFTDVATDASGNIYITGYTSGPTFPTIPDSIMSTNNNPDALVIALNSNLIQKWTTFYGGGLPTDVVSQGIDYSRSIVVDNNGNVFIGGHTQSFNLPIKNPGGGAYVDSTLSGAITNKIDMFIAQLKTNNGQLYWSTYLGGSTDTYFEDLWDMAVDPLGNLYIVGSRHNDTPLVSLAGAYNRTYGGGYIAKFNQNDSLVWATGFGSATGSVNIKSIACDLNGNVLITGVTGSTSYPTVNFGGGAYWQPSIKGNMDAFIAKFNAADSLIWSTYFGGDENDEGDGITTDNAGNIYLTGFSRSPTGYPFYNPPTTPVNMSYQHGPFAPFPYTVYGDIIIAKFSSTNVLLISGLYGGSEGDEGANITVDASNRVYVTGSTSGGGWPVYNPSPFTFWSQNTFSNTNGNGTADAFLISLSSNLVPLWATYYGGGSGLYGADWGMGMATWQNRLCMVGVTNSINVKIPLANLSNGAYYQFLLGSTTNVNDGFLAYFDISPLPLAINEFNNQNDDFSVYPNPTEGNFNVLVNTNSGNDLVIKIFNITGSCVFEKNYKNTFESQSISIDLSSISKGLYLIELKSDDNFITKKIVIQ